MKSHFLVFQKMLLPHSTLQTAPKPSKNNGALVIQQVYDVLGVDQKTCIKLQT